MSVLIHFTSTTLSFNSCYTDGRQIKGKTNIKYLSKVLGHYEPPEHLQCALALILQSLNSSGGMNTILPIDIPSFGVLMMVVESAVYRCLIGLRSGDCEGHSR